MKVVLCPYSIIHDLIHLFVKLLQHLPQLPIVLYVLDDDCR